MYFYTDIHICRYMYMCKFFLKIFPNFYWHLSIWYGNVIECERTCESRRFKRAPEM